MNPGPRTAPLKASGTYTVHDRFALESAIMDAEGDVALLELAIGDCLNFEAWETLNVKPIEGYRLLLVTKDQAAALNAAARHVNRFVKKASEAFYGPRAH